MAPITTELLAVLRCPVTGSSLELDGSLLRSTAKDHSGSPVTYTIDEGIPVLLRAELLDAATAAGSDQHDGPESPAATNQAPTEGKPQT